MHYGLIPLPIAQLARLLGLVRQVEAIPLDRRHRPDWGLLIHGRTFTRLLRAEVRALGAAGAWPRMPDGPERFIAKAQAERRARQVGLMPLRGGREHLPGL